MNSDTVAVDRSDFGTFIHSELDEAGLSVYAFRVYCHLARRANMNGKAWPGATSMSQICGMGETKVREAIRELEARKMVTVLRSSGGRASNHYYLNSKKNWVASVEQSTPSPDDPLATRGAPPRHARGTPSPRDGEGIPVRESNEDTPLLRLEAETPSKNEAEQLYDAYPRKVGKPAALKAIALALKKKPFAELIKAVKSYASARAGQDPTYTAHPATWFNQERYNDTTTPPSTNDSTTAAERVW